MRQSSKESQHETLAKLWLSRFFKLRPTTEDLNEAFSNTFIHACMPPPDCARALGYFILYKERPDLVSKHSELFEEYNQLMDVIHKATENDTIDELYSKYNPDLHLEQS